MPLSATLTPNVGGEKKAKAPPSPEEATSTSNTIQTLLSSSNSNPAPFSATEALQAALTSRYASSAAMRVEQQPWQQPSPGSATAALESRESASQETIMSTIGFGIDLGQGGNSSWNATEAAVRALRDAMERSTLRLPVLATLTDKPLELRVKLGVPPKSSLQPTEPMVVDIPSLTAVLPHSIPLHAPIQVVVGGLSVPGALHGKEPPMCAAIASISIMTSVAEPTDAAMESWSQLASQEEDTKPPAQPTKPAAQNDAPARVDSMSMLARISSAVRDNPSIVTGEGTAPTTGIAAAVAAAVAVKQAEERKNSMDSSSSMEAEVEHRLPPRKRSASSQEPPPSSGESSPTAKYQKRRPGLTPKKNTRQFVQHNYHDHANDIPIPGESATGPLDVDNVAFPYKMHDTLTRIESDGYGDVMSWMPHGRSFKIHNLDVFNETILPLYFRHSKKSSLLRQVRRSSPSCVLFDHCRYHF